MTMTMAEAAEFADMPAATLRDWFNNKPGKPPPPFAMATGDISARPGGTRMLSLHTTLAVIIAAALTRLSIPISRAAVAGMTFAHGRSGHPQRRHLGALYLDAPTYLAMRPEGPCEIFPAKPEELIAAIGAGATILHVDPIVRRLMHIPLMDALFGPRTDEEAGWSTFGWWEPETEYPADAGSTGGLA